MDIAIQISLYGYRTMAFGVNAGIICLQNTTEITTCEQLCFATADQNYCNNAQDVDHCVLFNYRSVFAGSRHQTPRGTAAFRANTSSHRHIMKTACVQQRREWASSDC